MAPRYKEEYTMIFEGLDEKMASEVIGLEKLSSPIALLDMSQLNEALGKKSADQSLDGISKNIQGSSEISDSNLYAHLGEPSDESKIPSIATHPTYEPIPGTGLSKVTDIFGNTRICDPNTVDIFSGLPQTVPDNVSETINVGTKDASSESGIHFTSRDQWKLDNAKQIEAIRDAAVEHYKDAKFRGDVKEMLKWEAEANMQQGRLYNVLGISGYTLNPKAPGIL